MNRSAAWMSLVLLGYLSPLTAGCHIHAPDDYPNFGNKPLVIPVIGDRTACQSLNRERFGSRGRCHCFDDAPLDAGRPGESGFSDNPTEAERPLP